MHRGYGHDPTVVKPNGGVMSGLVKFGFRFVPFIALGLMVAGCASTATVDPASEGYRALGAGDYAKARNVFAPLEAQNPHDPYLELDLAVSYQNLGRMNLAEPLYRSVLSDGKGVMPVATTSAADSGKSLADIACTNLRIGLNNPSAC
jgi:hypothetical protein